MNIIFLRSKPRVTVIALLAFIFLISLGMWQLQRAEEKTKILSTAAAFKTQAPTPWKPGMSSPLPYQAIIINGTALPLTLLLDNQYHQHQFGVHVISPVQLAGGKIVLVDRGWIKAAPSRVHFLSINSKNLQHELRGQVYYPSNKAMVLGAALEKKADNLILVEKLDAQLISNFLQKAVYPFIIRLGENEANGFVREWQSMLLTISPERHRAYALQWFLLAFVLLVCFIGLHKKSEI